MVGGESVELSTDQERVISAWNILEGKVDFSQIEGVAEYLQVVDIELFIDGLLLLKQHNDDHNNNSN